MNRRAFIIDGLNVVGLHSLSVKLSAFVDKPSGNVDTTFMMEGSLWRISFSGDDLDLDRGAIIERLRAAATAIVIYYGKFSVPRIHLLFVALKGRHGILGGTTWGNKGGYPAYLRLRVGTNTSVEQLQNDWVMTHELVHTFLPNLPEDQHWLEEGVASYVEPVARVQAGQLSSEAMWASFMDGMPNGEPGPGDIGLDHTHTWGRTYWGGALFCLIADVAIRQATSNRVGLQDGLRAVLRAGGTIAKSWSVERVFEIADGATGTSILKQMYRQWSETPVAVTLASTWDKLGIRRAGDSVAFDDRAEWSHIRLAITARNAS